MASSNLLTGSAPQAYARIGGSLYLIIIGLGIIQQFFIRGNIVVAGDAAATAVNLKSMEMLWRLGITIELVMIILTIGIGLILFVLTRPVNPNLALLAAFFNLLAIGTEAAYCLHLVEALFPLANIGYLQAFTQAQLDAMASLFIKSQSVGFAITLLLFGPFFFVTGYLIFKSRYLPRLLGLLYILSGISYSVSSLLLILAPTSGGKYYFLVAAPVLLGEVSLSLWLLIKGVNLEQWHKAVSQNQQPIAGLI